MGILKGCAKVAGSVILGAAGVASAVLRTAASGAGMEEVADLIGTIQDKSFDTIQDMWTPDEEKIEEYYESRGEKHAQRAQTAERIGTQKRQEYERMKERYGGK